MLIETLASSKASADANPLPQPSTTTQLDLVPVSWLFFDKSHPDNCFPLSIKIPRSLFSGTSQECRRVFATEILENFTFDAHESSIKFWKPKESLLLDTPVEARWIDGIDDIKDYFNLIPYPRSFATALEGEIDNINIVHLAVTAKGSYRATDVEAHDEGRDQATVLPEIQRYSRIVSTPGKSPSVGAKSKEYVFVQSHENQAIHDGRHPPNPEFSTVAPPVQIFHPVFDQFIQLVNDPSVQPTNKDLRQAQEFMHLLSAIGTWEPTRNATIRTKLTEILQLDVRQEPNTDSTSADGVHMLVLKRELGDAGCDPSTQAGLTMRRSWIQEDRKGIRDKCCCPTLILAGGGPWLCVLGGVFTDRVIVQRLTDLMWVGHSSTEEDPRVYRFARVLTALRQSLLSLQGYYKDISDPKYPSLKSGHTHPRFYPYPTSFFENGEVVHFEYVRILEDYAACVAFQAKILDDVGAPDIVVKFVSRYGADVHKFLAAENHAPRLRSCRPLSGRTQEPSLEMPSHGLSLGPIQMVVMDYVSDSGVTPLEAFQQIEVILYKLHACGYVFGDLRRQNVLFDEENTVKFIDFDWACRYDMNIRDKSLPAELQKTIDTNKENIQSTGHYVCYPLNLSKSITWAAGVEDLGPIRPQHDWDMLDQLDL